MAEDFSSYRDAEDDEPHRLYRYQRDDPEENEVLLALDFQEIIEIVIREAEP
jgi:hypothetical protein